MAANLLKFSLSISSNFPSTTTSTSHRRYIHRSHSPILPSRTHSRRYPNVIAAKSVDIKLPASNSSQSLQSHKKESSFLLDVSGMMCGACAIRVKKIISADDRVESAVVNMMTETAAVRLKSEGSGLVAEELTERLNECGFEAKKRVVGSGVGEKVRKWKEMAAKKKEMVEKSRNRVIFAWTLVALCCGSHASHILHSVGIHFAHVWNRV
ncbi:Copper-transporting ATPase PAA2 chloroplastic [Bienertia sinuspersici]